MSGADVSILLNSQYGNLSALLASPQTLWGQRGYDTTNIFAVDNTFRTTPAGNEVTFGQQVRFRLRKRGGRIHKAWLRLTISAGVLNAANRAAFVDDLGAAIIQEAKLQYASKDIHTFQGEMVKMYNRLMNHDINREAYNAMAFAGLPPGAGGAEAQREALTTTAFQLFVPLDWLFFTRFEDYALTPEALAAELELIIDYRALEQLVYARVIATGATVAGNPFTTNPIIASSELFTQLIYNPEPERNAHLMSFDTEQGQLFKILDTEVQLNQQFIVSAVAETVNVRLDNFRLDSHFIMFMIRNQTILTNWNVDRMQSDTTATILPGGGSVAALLQCTSFRLTANGRVIVDTCTDIENRAVWRHIYFPGCQIAEPIYFIPFAWLLKDAKNVTSFQNMANLGNVVLEILMPAHPAMQVDVYNICHNVIQQNRGDIIRSLR